MEEIVIDVSVLSKKYKVGKRVVGDLRSTLKDVFKNKQLNDSQDSSSEFWALKDITFQVKRGEVMGIVGANGSGKSTLLKILSRITPPTSGRIGIEGRVASLLEVGTGFHPELTGRENVFLNGSLLGMKKLEIKEKFDEIVDFSGVERFVDTPVKHYSSGMYVRLAFAVAAHLEPEILIVDEVLAVGDTAFQNKCLGKMREVANGGRTVIFVSHNSAALESLCNRGILLERGKLLKIGSIKNILTEYLSRISSGTRLSVSERKDRTGKGKLKFTEAFITDENNQRIKILSSGQKVKIVLMYKSEENSFENIVVKIEFKDQLGRYMFICVNEVSQGMFKMIPGNGLFVCTIPKLILNDGIYYLDLIVKGNGKNQDTVRNAMEIKVIPGHFYPTGILPKNRGVLTEYSWDFESH